MITEEKIKDYKDSLKRLLEFQRSMRDVSKKKYLIDCDRCNGWGILSDEIDDGSGFTRRIFVPCDICNGRGIKK